MMHAHMCVRRVVLLDLKPLLLAPLGTTGTPGEFCLSPSTVTSTLKFMLSCGMNDYSGEWSVKLGLPAKSGVAGLVYIVVPNVSVRVSEQAMAVWC